MENYGHNYKFPHKLEKLPKKPLKYRLIAWAIFLFCLVAILAYLVPHGSWIGRLRHFVPESRVQITHIRTVWNDDTLDDTIITEHHLNAAQTEMLHDLLRGSWYTRYWGNRIYTIGRDGLHSYNIFIVNNDGTKDANWIAMSISNTRNSVHLSSWDGQHQGHQRFRIRTADWQEQIRRILEYYGD